MCLNSSCALKKPSETWHFPQMIFHSIPFLGNLDFRRKKLIIRWEKNKVEFVCFSWHKQGVFSLIWMSIHCSWQIGIYEKETRGVPGTRVTFFRVNKKSEKNYNFYFNMKLMQFTTDISMFLQVFSTFSKFCQIFSY